VGSGSITAYANRLCGSYRLSNSVGIGLTLNFGVGAPASAKGCEQFSFSPVDINPLRSSSRTPHVSQFDWIGGPPELIPHQQSLAATMCCENGDLTKVPTDKVIPAPYL
jgi:hypothetical protein